MTATGRPAAFASTRDHADLPHQCGRCPARWSGSQTAHCPSCHRTFTGVGPFDAHRRGGQCLDPHAIGMELVDGRAYEAWAPVRRDETGALVP